MLRIGRTTAYELARRDLMSDGGKGIPVLRMCSISWRRARAADWRSSWVGPITWRGFPTSSSRSSTSVMSVRPAT